MCLGGPWATLGTPPGTLGGPWASKVMPLGVLVRRLGLQRDASISYCVALQGDRGNLDKN